MMLRRRDKRRYLAIVIDKDQFLNILSDPKYHPTFHDPKRQSNYEKKSTELKKGQIDFEPLKILLKIIKKRFSDLFGYIELEKSGIQLITGKKIKFEGVFILKCNLSSIDKVLFTLSMCNKPVITTLKMSGTLRKLISVIDPVLTVFNNTST